MKLIFTLLVLCGQAFTACHTVSFAGSGTKSGADWNNTAQWQVTAGFTGATLVSGDSYYFQDSSVTANTISGIVTTTASPTSTAVRASGSWITDGVSVGYEIKFSGFANFNNNSAWYYVTNVTASTLTLVGAGFQNYLTPTSILVSETSSSGAVSYVARNPANDYPGVSITATNVTLRNAWGAVAGGQHCTDTGWVQATMGSGSAYFGAANLNSHSNGVGYTLMISMSSNSTLDGSLRSDELHGYGFVVDCTQTTGFYVTCIGMATGSMRQYTEVYASGLANNSPTPKVYNITGATVTVASNLLTITGLGAGSYTPLGALVIGDKVKFTTGIVGAASFLGGNVVTVCDPGQNASCVTPSATQFSANFTHANFGPDATSTGSNTVEVNIAEQDTGINGVGGSTQQYNFDHDTSNNTMQTGSNSNNNTVQYNVFARVYSSNAVHGGGICGNQNGVLGVFRDFTIRYNKFIDISGTALVDTLTAGTMSPGSITSVQVASNVLTVNFSGVATVPATGVPFTFTGLTNAAFLNPTGSPVVPVVVRASTATSSQITAAFIHADYNCSGIACSDTGKILTSNDNLQFYGNYIACTGTNNTTCGLGDYDFFCGAQGAVPQAACTNINFYNNTFVNQTNVGVVYRAEDYGSITWQNNLIVNTTYGTNFNATGANMGVTDDHNTIWCLTGYSCDLNHGRVEGFNCINDDCQPANSSTGTQTNPFTGSSWPTNILKADLAAATTTGASLAFTDLNGTSAPQGGIYNRGFVEFVTAGGPYLVTITCAGNANGTVTETSLGTATCTAGVCSGSCSHSYTAASTPTFTATATTGSLSSFLGGICNGSPCTPTVNAPLTLTATFQLGVTCSLAVGNSVNSPQTISTTSTLSGLSGVGSFWYVYDPFNATIVFCGYPYSGCSAGGLTGNLPYTSSGQYTLSAISNGVPCPLIPLTNQQPLNVSTGPSGAAAH